MEIYDVKQLRQQQRPQQGENQVSTRSVRQSISAQTRNELNASIIQMTTNEPSLSVRDQPLKLVYKAAIEKLNEVLEPELGDKKIEDLNPDDFTPEKVAERIVGFATAFYGAYKANHEGEDEEGVLSGFMETIRSGIEQGFNEARDILDGLGVYDGTVKENADKTYSLIQDLLSSFEERMRPGGEEQGEVTESAAEESAEKGKG